MIYRNGQRQQIDRRKSPHETEDYGRADFAEGFQRGIRTVVHITHIGHGDGRERESADVEDDRKSHNSVHRKILLLNQKQDRRDHKRDKQGHERVGHAAHHDGDGKQRIDCGKDDCKPVARILSAVEINHCDYRHIGKHADHTDEHRNSVRGQVLPHCADYGKDIHRAGRHRRHVHVAPRRRICVNVADTVFRKPSREVHRRVRFTAETVHRQQEHKTHDEGAEHQHRRDKPAVRPPLGGHGGFRSALALLPALGRVRRRGSRASGSAVEVDEHVAACVILSDEHICADDHRNAEQREEGHEQRAGKVTVVARNLRHPEIVHGGA